MKLTKIFAGMAAAAIATTAMAVTAFAADSTAYNYLYIATDIPCEYNENVRNLEIHFWSLMKPNEAYRKRLREAA